MKASMRDRIKGELHEIKGRAKEKVGHITNSRRMAAAGRSETLAGTIQKKFGRIKRVFGM
jgi:uncharacterized protein YjbJ (UPF0337 family)